MPKRPSPYPTEAELEILNVLWRRGPSTVREIHEILQADRRTALTTTLKIVQVMEGKGLVIRSSARPTQYSAIVTEEKTQAGLLKDLLQRAFDGSMQKLLVRAVEDVGISGSEFRDIQKLVQAKRKGKTGSRP
jgi:predicted transcriptional regulator